MNEKDSKRFSIKRVIQIGFTLVGVLMIAAALLVDVVISGLSSGIGPLQIIISLVGLVLVILPWIPLSVIGRGMITVVTVIIMVIVLEIALWAAGYKPDYSAPPNFDPHAAVDLQLNDIRICDEEYGCHWNVERQRATCSAESQNRMCHINQSGFTSVYEFTAESLPPDSYRILVLGDSFTWGASADYGQGWVDVMERELQATNDVIVWNAAMPGTGTGQASITAQKLLPIMHPDLVILGFHSGNDFADNLYPYDRFINVLNEHGQPAVTQQYSLDASGKPFRETDAVLYYRANGYKVSSTGGFSARFRNLLQRTRLGTLLIGGYDVLTWTAYNSPPTETLLENLHTLVTSNNSALLVLIIPEQADADAPTQKYRAARMVLENTHIPFVDSLPLLNVKDFVNADSSDKHLNNNGHAKTGQMMATCVQRILESGITACIAEG